MTDRVIQYPGRYKLTLVSGTTDTYDLVAVPGTITAAGTDLNKGNFLSDTVAAAIATLTGITLSSDPTINEMLSGLASCGLLKGSTYSYTGTGTYGSTNKKSVTIHSSTKMVIIQESSASSANFHTFIAVQGSTYALAIMTDNTTNKCTLTWSTTTLQFYNAIGAGQQMNGSGLTYKVIDIY